VKNLVFLTAVLIGCNFAYLEAASTKSKAITGEPIPSRCNIPSGFIGIRTPQELQNISDNLSGNYFLCNDLNMAGFAFEPIGTGNLQTFTAFRGILEGNSKRIYNLQIGSPNAQFVGIFGFLNGKVQHLILEQIQAQGSFYIGILASYMDFEARVDDLILRNVEVVQKEIPPASGTAGGLAASCGGTVSHIDAIVKIEGTTMVGGLCGMGLGASATRGESACGARCGRDFFLHHFNISKNEIIHACFEIHIACENSYIETSLCLNLFENEMLNFSVEKSKNANELCVWTTDLKIVNALGVSFENTAKCGESLKVAGTNRLEGEAGHI
jgi:hypothetical protein